MAVVSDQLTNLKKLTTIVADTGEVNQIKQYEPQDATTNPSLLYKAAGLEEYQSVVSGAVEWAKAQKGNVMEDTLDKLAVDFGCNILKMVPGLVSTEIDARLSFDKDATLAKCRKLMKLYEEAGVDPKKRVLFKIASTWEGIQAMKELQAEGVNCNMTLLFNLWQAAACAENGAYLISPFVGRITDYFKAKNGWTELPPVSEDPGVQSVKQIFNYYKKFGYKTVVMGASFRSKEQVLGLAGCDRLTVAPKLLKQMGETNADVPQCLDANAKDYDGEKLVVTESAFRFGLCCDAMATEKLANGISRFAQDTVKLENLLKEKYSL